MTDAPLDLNRLFAPLARFERVLVCVSGGADSIALLCLVHEWCANKTDVPNIRVATVDHRYRDTSRAEADHVAQLCASMGLPHTILEAPHKSAMPSEAAARELRYALLSQFAADTACSKSQSDLKGTDRAALVLAHHADDQAETLLMRLARGSGLAGLSGMHPESSRSGVTLLRPLLQLRKAQLCRLVEARGLTWFEDTSNADPAFERARIRQALSAGPPNADLNAALAKSAARLTRANDALNLIAGQVWQSCVIPHPLGYCSVDLPAYRSHPAEIRLRLLARLIRSVRPGTRQSTFSPISAALEALDEDLMEGSDPTRPGSFATRNVAGCLFERQPHRLTVAREPFRKAHAIELNRPVPSGTPHMWDNRFLIRHTSSPASAVSTDTAAAMVRPLGSAAARRLLNAHDALRDVPLAALGALPAIPADDAANELRPLPIMGVNFETSPKACNHLSATFVGFD